MVFLVILIPAQLLPPGFAPATERRSLPTVLVALSMFVGPTILTPSFSPGARLHRRLREVG
jgi:hypothetical protein